MAAALAAAGSGTAGEKSSEAATVEPPCKRPNQGDVDDSTVGAPSCAQVTATEGGDNTTEMADMDQEGFKVVSHRKRRTVGIPVLLSPTEKGKDLRRENPIALFSVISSLLGKAPNRGRFTAQGALLLDVTTEEEVDILLRCNRLGGVAVCARLPYSYVQNTCIIRGVPKWHTEEELLTYLRPQGVTHVRRVVRRDPSSPDKWQVVPTDAVVLTFPPNSERPEKINLGFTRHVVADYTESPPRCFKCQRYGHVAKSCRGEQRCKRCGGPHDFMNCKRDVTCANCGGDHPASYSGCPFRVSALHQRKAFLSGPESPPQSPQPSDEQHFPALPSLESADVKDSAHGSPCSSSPELPGPPNATESMRETLQVKRRPKETHCSASTELPLLPNATASAKESPRHLQAKQRKGELYSRVLKERHTQRNQKEELPNTPKDREQVSTTDEQIKAMLKQLIAALRLLLVDVKTPVAQTAVQILDAVEPFLASFNQQPAKWP